MNKTYRVFASGFRAPSGITTRHGDNGQEIWALDQGPRGGDELNLIKFGKNYGWPMVSYETKYFVPKISSSTTKLINTKFGTHDGFQPPKFVWTPSVAPSALVTLTEDFGDLTAWSKNDLLIGTLQANSLIHIKLNGDQVILAEQVNIGARIRDISIKNKIIFVSTDDGRVMSFIPEKINVPSGPFPDIYPQPNYIYLHGPGIKPLIWSLDNLLNQIAKLL